MKYAMVLSLFLLGACDAAGPGFRGVEPTVRVVEGSRFALRFRGDLVEAVRTSPEWLPKFEDVARKAALAAEAERPGCQSEWVEGDPSTLLLGLSCDGARAPKPPKRRGMLLCDLFDANRDGGLYGGSLSCIKA